MNEARWPCDVRFEEPFGRSRCHSCGREWEAMTPKGSERHCVRELGSRLTAARLRICELESALCALRPFIQNITLRAVIDEALPKETPAVT